MDHEDKIYTRGTVDWRSKNSQVLDSSVDTPYLLHFSFFHFYFFFKLLAHLNHCFLGLRYSQSNLILTDTITLSV